MHTVFPLHALSCEQSGTLSKISKSKGRHQRSDSRSSLRRARTEHSLFDLPDLLPFRMEVSGTLRNNLKKTPHAPSLSTTTFLPLCMSAFSLPPSRPKASPNFRSSAAGLALSPTKAQSTLRFDQEPPPKRPVFEPVHKKKRPISFDDGKKDDANPKGLPVFTLQDDGRSPKARRPAVVFTRCASEADDLVACLQGPLAFDMVRGAACLARALSHLCRALAQEWPVVRRKGATEQKTALIQIGDANMIVLIQISAMRWVVRRALSSTLPLPPD